MNTKPAFRMLALAAMLLVTINSRFSNANAQGTAFTYQGQLYTGTNLANGDYDFQFALSNAPSGGMQIGGTLTNLGVGVTNGLFITALDFGQVFTGQSSWLAIAVRTNGGSGFTPLSPLQAITPTPYALYAESANAANLVGTVQSANLSGVALLAAGNNFTGGSNTFAGSVGIGTTRPNSPLAVYGNIFMGQQRNNTTFNQIGDTIYLGAEQKFLGNTLGVPVDGSTDWINLMANSLSAGIMFGVSTSTSSPHSNIVPLMVIQSNGNVGIGATNPATALQVNGTVTATSFSGSGSGLTNVAVLNQANTFSAQQIFMVSPFDDGCVVSDGVNRLGSYIGAGQCSFGTFTTHGLGFFVNNGFDSMFLDLNGKLGIGTSTPANKLDVQGGADFTGNVGIGTTTPAGPLTVATANGSVTIQNGQYTAEMIASSSIAPGHMRFRNGFEVWPDTNSVNAGYLDIRATNGSPRIILDGSTGEITCVALNMTSDRNAKQNFESIDTREVLNKVASLPITEWQYKGQSDTRHIGPMAQDFREAFTLGHDEKHISVIDEGGVALAAIQGLNAKLDEKDARIKDLEKSMDELKKLVAKLAVQKAGGDHE